jgi:hypothetical protein
LYTPEKLLVAFANEENPNKENPRAVEMGYFIKKDG